MHVKSSLKTPLEIYTQGVHSTEQLEFREELQQLWW